MFAGITHNIAPIIAFILIFVGLCCFGLEVVEHFKSRKAKAEIYEIERHRKQMDALNPKRRSA